MPSVGVEVFRLVIQALVEVLTLKMTSILPLGRTPRGERLGSAFRTSPWLSSWYESREVLVRNPDTDPYSRELRAERSLPSECLSSYYDSDQGSRADLLSRLRIVTTVVLTCLIRFRGYEVTYHEAGS